MKILTIAQRLSATEGWGTLSRSAVKGLSARGHDVLVLVETVNPSIGISQRAVLPHPTQLLKNPLAWFSVAKTISRTVDEWKPDIIHIHVEPYALALALASYVRSFPPVVLTLCGTYAIFPLSTWKTRWLMERAYGIAAHCMAISHYTLERVLAELPSIKTKSSVWTLGIDPPPYQPKAAGLRPADMQRILFVGGVKPRKGVMEVINACGEFQKTTEIPFHLDIVGSNPPSSYAVALENRVKELGIADSVTFHGHISDEKLNDLYAHADLLMMLSQSHGYHFEGFGLVFLEANARGIPVIGPRKAGCADAISDGRSGYLVDDPTDASAIAERMAWILRDHTINPADCRAWVEEHSVERMAKEAEEIYESVNVQRIC